jgi:2-amino-4-hydroxy-6-hydroxymethyldihydropteridine diphosphokinase
MAEVVKMSSLYETAPVGGPPHQGNFLDASAEIRTLLTPHALLEHLKEIEQKAGRTPSNIRWGPREIDLDILLYGDLILNQANLTIPHPLLHLRRFMIEPLAEIAPGVFHPLLKKTVSEIMRSISSKEK